jgi:hypothetical protein
MAIAVGRSQAILEHCPDGVFWVALGPKPNIRLLLENWGSALGVNLLAERDENACQQRLRSLLSRRRALLIIDDVWSASDGRAFLLGGSACRTLLTTREMPVANELATSSRTLRVDILSPGDALELLAQLAPETVRSDPASARILCRSLENLPLALALAGQLLAGEAAVPGRLKRLVSDLIERREARLRLSQPAGRLGLSETEPVSLHAILGLSVERLSAVDQDRFAMLSVFGGEPLTWEIRAAQHVWGCSLEEAEETTSCLVQRGLVYHRSGRYWMHALLADYAEGMREARGL